MEQAAATPTPTRPAKAVDAVRISAHCALALRGTGRHLPPDDDIREITALLTTDIRALIPLVERIDPARQPPRLVGALADAEYLLGSACDDAPYAGASQRHRMARWTRMRALARVCRVLLAHHPKAVS